VSAKISIVIKPQTNESKKVKFTPKSSHLAMLCFQRKRRYVQVFTSNVNIVLYKNILDKLGVVLYHVHRIVQIKQYEIHKNT